MAMLDYQRLSGTIDGHGFLRSWWCWWWNVAWNRWNGLFPQAKKTLFWKPFYAKTIWHAGNIHRTLLGEYCKHLVMIWDDEEHFGCPCRFKGILKWTFFSRTDGKQSIGHIISWMSQVCWALLRMAVAKARPAPFDVGQSHSPLKFADPPVIAMIATCLFFSTSYLEWFPGFCSEVFLAFASKASMTVWKTGWLAYQLIFP